MYNIFSLVFTMLSSKYPKMKAGLERKCDEKVMNITLKQIYFLSFGGFMSIKQKHFREFLTTFIYRIMKSIIENVPNKSTSWKTVQFSIKACRKIRPRRSDYSPQMTGATPYKLTSPGRQALTTITFHIIVFAVVTRYTSFTFAAAENNYLFLL